MKRHLSRTIALLLAVALVALLGACAQSAPPTAAPTTDSSVSTEAPTMAPTEAPTPTPAALTPFDPPVTLSLSMLGTGLPIMDGVQPDPVAKEIEKRLGIILNLTSSTTSDSQMAMIASGDMGDYMQLLGGPGETAKAECLRLAASNQLLDLNSLMLKYGPHLQKLEKQVNFWRSQYGTGNDSFYLACGGIGPTNGLSNGIGVVLRFDYYEELGCPPIKSLDDWLNVVQQMLEKHPTTDDGQKRYGFTFFTEWGWTTMPGHLAIMDAAFNGKAYNMDYGSNTGYYPGEKRVEDPYLDPESPFWHALQFYNKAYQRGMLDPDYMTNKWDNIIEKSNADRILSAIWTWSYADINARLAPQGAGYIEIPLQVQNIAILSDQLMGTDYCNHVIPASCKNPEAAMRLMDFLFSEEGSMLIWNGIEGKDYELKDGKYVKTQSSIDAQKASKNWAMESGIGLYGNYVGLYMAYANSKTGQQMQLMNTSPDDLNPFQKKYCEKYGLKFPWDNLKDIPNKSMDVTVTSLLNSMPDDMKTKRSTIGDWVAVEGLKLISAKTDAEFEAGKQAIIERMKAEGWEEIFTSFLQPDWQQALAKVDKYLN